MKTNEEIAAFEKLSDAEQAEAMHNFTMDVLDAAKKRGVPGPYMVRCFGVVGDAIVKIEMANGAPKIPVMMEVINAFVGAMGMKRGTIGADPDTPVH